VDSNLVDARQQARRVLDRIVGLQSSRSCGQGSPRTFRRAFQTVALRLIVGARAAIRAFVPQEYWTIHAMLDAGQPPLFEAKLFKHKGEDIAVSNQETRTRLSPR